MSDWIGYVAPCIIGVGACVCFYCWGIYDGLKLQMESGVVEEVKEAIKRNKGGLRSIIQGLQPPRENTP